MNICKIFFLDEAAQALETECLIAISLAGPETKLIFAGDSQQVGPQLMNPTLRRAGAQISLLERLGKFESLRSTCFQLTHNYRSHHFILCFMSENFYCET